LQNNKRHFVVILQPQHRLAFLHLSFRYINGYDSTAIFRCISIPLLFPAATLFIAIHPRRSHRILTAC
jgi:hypothetical protein